jgi:hypothetical protein
MAAVLVDLDWVAVIEELDEDSSWLSTCFFCSGFLMSSSLAFRFSLLSTIWACLFFLCLAVSLSKSESSKLELESSKSLV